MTTLVPPVPLNAPRWPALIPPVLIAIPIVLKLVGVDVNNAWIIFALLIGLMLTGMPISISLGLTVLIYLFTMTTVPIESVALKLFTGIERFEIMAIPFFILAGNFLTHGGVARRMIAFASSMVGHWYGGLGAGRRCGLCVVRRGIRLVLRPPSWLSAQSSCRRWSSRASRPASAPVSSRHQGHSVS